MLSKWLERIKNNMNILITTVSEGAPYEVLGNLLQTKEVNKKYANDPVQSFIRAYC